MFRDKVLGHIRIGSQPFGGTELKNVCDINITEDKPAWDRILYVHEYAMEILNSQTVPVNETFQVHAGPTTVSKGVPLDKEQVLATKEAVQSSQLPTVTVNKKPKLTEPEHAQAKLTEEEEGMRLYNIAQAQGAQAAASVTQQDYDLLANKSEKYDNENFKKVRYSNVLETSPHVVAQCINMVVSPTELELSKSLSLLPDTFNSGSVPVKSKFSIVGQVIIQIKSIINNTEQNIKKILEINQTASSKQNILKNFADLQIFYFVVNNDWTVSFYGIPVSSVYGYTQADRAALIDSDDDASLWMVSGLHVYFTPEAILDINDNDRNKAICKWVAYNDMVCVFATMTDAYKWTQVFDKNLAPKNSFTEIRVDAVTAMLAYSENPIMLQPIHQTYMIDQNSGFKYVGKEQTRVWDIICKARPYLGDKIRNVVMHVAPGIGIQMPDAILVATDTFACINACIFDAKLNGITIAKDEDILTTRLSNLLTAICLRNASHMRDTGFRMQHVYDAAVTDALMHLNSFVRMYSK